mgnify:CR=1 FL=1
MTYYQAEGGVLYKWVEGLDNLYDEFSDQWFLNTDEVLETPVEYMFFKVFEELWERGFIKNVEGDPKNGMRFLVKEKTQKL